MCCLPLNQIEERNREVRALFFTMISQVDQHKYDDARRKYQEADNALQVILKEAWDELQGSIQTDN